MRPSWKWLAQTAQEELDSLQQALPPAVQAKLQQLVVIFAPGPHPELVAEGIAPDTLGLFEGASLPAQEGETLWPPQITLFLDNIWQAAQADSGIYRQEIRTTYLHELGHYLGLAESDMPPRQLD